MKTRDMKIKTERVDTLRDEGYVTAKDILVEVARLPDDEFVRDAVLRDALGARRDPWRQAVRDESLADFQMHLPTGAIIWANRKTCAMLVEGGSAKKGRQKRERR